MIERDERSMLAAVDTLRLLEEIGRRFRLRFGRIEIVFHDGRPSPKVTVEHRVQKDLNVEERPPASTGGSR